MLVVTEPGLSKPKLIAVLAKALRAADKGRLLTDGSDAMEAVKNNRK